jgi:hypothetical protein
MMYIPKTPIVTRYSFDDWFAENKPSQIEIFDKQYAQLAASYGANPLAWKGTKFVFLDAPNLDSKLSPSSGY